MPKKTATKAAPTVPAPATDEKTGEKVGDDNAQARDRRPGVMLDFWIEPYLEELARCGQVTKAAAFAEISTKTVIRRRMRDETFKRREIEAQEDAGSLFESEAIRRAIDGVVTSITTKPNGETLKRIEYSDTILLRLLEKRETGSWRQKQQIEHGMMQGQFATRAERKAALEKMRAEIAREDAKEAGSPLSLPSGDGVGEGQATE